MAKNSVYDWDTTPANNTDVGGVGITGNSLPSNLDDGMRTLMAQIKSWSTSLGLSSGDQVAKLGSANTFTATQTISGTGPTIQLTDTSISNLIHFVRSLTDDLSLEGDINNVNPSATIRFRLGGSQIANFDKTGNLYTGAAFYAGSSEVFFGGSSSNDKLAYNDTDKILRLFVDGSTNTGNMLAGGFATSTTAISDGDSYNGDGVSINFAAGRSVFSRSSATPVTVNRNNTSGAVMSIRRVATEVGSITVSGSTTTYNQTSDETYKNFTGVYSGEDAISIILADPVRTWTWVPERGGYADKGWGSQTSYALSSDLATPGGWFDNDTGEPAEPNAENAYYQPWGLDLSKRTPYLWAATAHLVSKIADLETRLAALEAGA